MAVLEVIEIPEDSGSKSGGDRSYTRVFKAKTDDMHDDALIVRSAAAIPNVGTWYTNSNGTSLDWGSVVKDIQADRSSNSPFYWIVTVDYARPDLSDDAPSDPENPWDEPAKYSFSSNSIEEPIEKAIKFLNPGLPALPEFDNYLTSIVDKPPYTNVPVGTSAGEVLHPPKMMRVGIQVVNIQKYMRSYSPATAASWRNSINSVPFAGGGIHTVMLTDYSGSGPEYTPTNNVEYWSVHLQFEMRDDGWNVDVLDEGVLRLEEQSSTKSTKIMDSKEVSSPVTSPLYLNGLGTPQQQQTGPDLETYWRRYQIYREKDFTLLQL